MPIKKKHIIVGGIALLSLTAAYLYWQFMKLKDSAIKFGGIKFKSISQYAINFDLILLFTNASKLKIEIVSQEYKVFINNIFVTTISNPNSQIIEKFSTSPITVNVNINNLALLNALKNNYKDILLSPDNIILKVNCSIKVKLFGITVNVPYQYTSNLKDLMAKSTTP